MTREEEIKERVEVCGAYYTYDGRKVATIEAEADLRYLLARNEELQRRVDVMEKALKFYARLDDDMEYDEIEEDHGRRAVAALAKERDDA